MNGRPSTPLCMVGTEDFIPARRLLDYTQLGFKSLRGSLHGRQHVRFRSRAGIQPETNPFRRHVTKPVRQVSHGFDRGTTEIQAGSWQCLPELVGFATSWVS